YNQFGDWYLAMAAYNSGPGKVKNAVKRTGYADFWELYRRNVLPRETRNYVPIILAVTIMAKNPAQYGLDRVVPSKPVPSDTVKEGDTLASIARSYRTTAKAIASTNNLDGSGLEPDSTLIIPIAPGKHGVMEDPATYTRRATAYKVRKGDTVAAVADNFGVPPAMVRRWNRLKGNSLRGRRVV